MKADEKAEATALPRDPVHEELLRALEAESGRSVYACYQCGKCTAACPFEFSPQRVMRHLQLGQLDRALEMDTTWVCASCLTCSRVCPKDADPAGVMKTLRGVREGRLAGETTEELRRDGRRELTDLAAEQYRRHAHPLRSYFLTHIDDMARRGSRFAPVSNWPGKIPGSKLVAHHLLGIHKERELPVWARPSFPEWFVKREPLGDGHRGDVLLFHDTFMDYDAPRIGVSATELLELAGYRVALSDTVCCGRPMISKGYLDRAREQARINVERLHVQIAAGAFVVGCEPSCLLTVREEYPRLLAGTELEERAREVAARCLLVDEFLADPERGEELPPRFDAGDGSPVLFHGHCQQKAEADPEQSLVLLRQAGFDAEMVAAPCCGMAGAFGMEKEHYAASRAAFERALGPALEARPEARLVVMGISCRKQIEHFASRPAAHLVEVLRSAASAAPSTPRGHLRGRLHNGPEPA
jgi:Fe-S oxidoreductase